MAGEYYDEEFIRDLKTGETMMKQLRDRTEKEIIKKWMARVCKLKSSDIKVKKARNEFYKYLIELMKTALIHEKEIADETKTKKKQMSYKSTWSPDRRTYVAIQPLPNQGALIYMACNARPDLGWDVPAKKKH